MLLFVYWAPISATRCPQYLADSVRGSPQELFIDRQVDVEGRATGDRCGGGSGWRTGGGGPPCGWRAYVLAGAGAAAAAAEAAGEERWKEVRLNVVIGFSPDLPKFHLLSGLSRAF